ncbi:MAG: hypothetical protein U0836_15640 [Pirellulales bacterium]
MNEDNFERELAALRPLGVRPRLEQGIAAELATTSAAPLAPVDTRLVRFARRSAALAVAAALLVAAAFFASPEPRLDQATARLVPTALNYQQAFARSPASLDALLDLHAGQLGLASAGSPRARDSFDALNPL